MLPRTLLSVTNTVQPVLQGERPAGTCWAHWPVAPAVQLLAPSNTAAYSDTRVPQVLRPPSPAEPPEPVVPPVPPLVPPVAPLIPPVPDTYEQKPALPPSVDTQVVLSVTATGQPSSQVASGTVPAQPAACQAPSIVESAELSVT